MLTPRYIILLLAAGGILFAALNFNQQPLRPIEEFVIFGSQNVTLQQETQVLRGNVGANDNLLINQDSNIAGDLFGSQITLTPGVIISGSAFSKRLISNKAEILGSSSSRITFPVTQIPAIPNFNPGNQDLKIPQNTASTLPPGSFKDITIAKNSRAVFEPGVYDIRSLTVQDNAKLVFSASTTVNIGQKVNFGNNILLYSVNNEFPPQAVLFQTPSKPPLIFGQNNNLSFRLVAPNAHITIGQNSLIRGNLWSKSIVIGKQSAVRDTIWFGVPSPSEDIVIVDGTRFVINVVEVNFTDAANLEDAERIALFLNARIVGFGPTTNLYGFQIPTRTVEELDVAIASVEALNDPKIEGVFPAFLPELD